VRPDPGPTARVLQERVRAGQPGDIEPDEGVPLLPEDPGLGRSDEEGAVPEQVKGGGAPSARERKEIDFLSTDPGGSPSPGPMPVNGD
jgi:hypothetical protein